MKKWLNFIISHPLTSGVMYTFIGSIGASVIHFLFNLYMVKHLSDVDYGILGSVGSYIALPALVASAIVPVVITFAASSFASGDLHIVRSLFIKINKYVVIVGLPLFILLLFITPNLSAFFHISNATIFILADIIILFNLLGVINTAFLNAKLAFKLIACYQISVAVIKLVLGILFVGLGWDITGAILAICIAFLIPYVLTFIPLNFVFGKEDRKAMIRGRDLLTYGIPSGLSLLSLNMFITTDILLVKHFYSPQQAGLYAAISLVGKIVFFISSPIASVMFPLVVQKHTKNENYFSIFNLALSFVLLSSAALTGFYFLFPGFVVSFVTKNTYLGAVPYIGLYGIYISIFCLLTILTNFFLSIKQVKVYIPLLIGAVVQFGVLWINHKSFAQIIWNSIGIAGLLLIVLLLYYFNIYGKKRNTYH
jgi:O-antigen/teichoic acid export membrane protein